jgi:hypothetical protein
MLFKDKVILGEVENALVYRSVTERSEQKEIERLFTRLFSSEDGRRVLAYLQVMTFQRVQGASTSDEHLRYMEGQRSLVATILRLIDRGRRG